MHTDTACCTASHESTAVSGRIGGGCAMCPLIALTVAGAAALFVLAICLRHAAGQSAVPRLRQRTAGMFVMHRCCSWPGKEQESRHQ